MTQSSIIRRKLGLSQTDFARLMAVDQGTISRWEHGICPPSGPAVQLMSIFLTMPHQQIDALLGRAAAETTTTNNENA